VDSFYDYLFIYKVLEKINEKKNLENLNISIFITKCDQYTIANIINFLNMGIKNIFLCKCLPTLVNPSMVSTMQKVFGIREFSTPEEDIKKTLS
jgi:hydroxylamine reductase (hybrid-cluster protein)